MILNQVDFREICPECSEVIVGIPEGGQVTCHYCGLVLDEGIIDISHSGKRAFTKAERKTKESTGFPITPLVFDLGLTTVIDKSKIKNSDLKRATDWDSRLPWSKRNLLIATSEVKRIVGELSLPYNIKVLSMRFYRKIVNMGLLKGRSLDGMVAACLYCACRFHNNSTTIDEIVDFSNSSLRTCRQSYNLMVRKLKLRVPPINPIQLIPRYINDLKIVGNGLSIQIERTAIVLITQFISNFDFSGKNPKGLCAAAIYISCRYHHSVITQKMICDLLKISEVTLRSRRKELKKRIKITSNMNLEKNEKNLGEFKKTNNYENNLLKEDSLFVKKVNSLSYTKNDIKSFERAFPKKAVWHGSTTEPFRVWLKHKKTEIKS